MRQIQRHAGAVDVGEAENDSVDIAHAAEHHVIMGGGQFVDAVEIHGIRPAFLINRKPRARPYTWRVPAKTTRTPGRAARQASRKRSCACVLICRSRSGQRMLSAWLISPAILKITSLHRILS